MTERDTLDERGMTVEEQELADAIYGAIQSASNYSERSQQSADFRIGVSDLGFCSERVRRMLAGIPEPITDKLPAFIGTALGDHVEKAIKEHLWPEATLQAEVTLDLVGDGGTYHVTGHPDVLVDNLVIDVKSSRGLSIARRSGLDLQKQFQRHCYAKAAWQQGLLSGPLEEVQVANVWVDRAADDRHLYVSMEPFSESIVQQAAMWLDDVIYAYLHQEPAKKEPPREMCAKACGHFADCRALDTDVEGLLTSDLVLSSIDMYKEGTALIREGERLKDQAKAHLVDVQGSTGEFTVRWVYVNPSEVSYVRAGYDRLDIRKIK